MLNYETNFCLFFNPLGVDKVLLKAILKVLYIIIYWQNLPNNTILKIFQPDSMRSNLFSKLDSFWKPILTNSTSGQNQALQRQIYKFDVD